ncbi:MAG: DUF3800 domain-containing protein [Microcoleus sp. PH2017_10_PVI_O_A]|uniref:DUF3800 domain-containing protein n=1 Tax=unclassified Microcoleus TaxID=2642155 RepID=UPI001D66DF4E|nr:MULTISPECIES: DUF3800 domain-containing protein [unclassified Microcoleus]TAE82111.1 MAG: DUF3800 domain-containing protein [Oscillatoriales cyanobacterium]MCC3404885.1 DUF3800 domain-containing protein [Microcoleus sp. PH2017_10_PVI_O_A]MCC3460071.1 DUF3800 domain-containing protein [Microcoleus sp. PH2017_11_PCY_U_A]MCC3478575.1 DUF3800 domain-containing protein [Microcoleus sp. PH2017_12_PCY_D_A]MCC3559422.1 DUF3800 domain-containing protein [Microcoleus sp. PH2017_27_LUM_O_A]
MKPTVQEIYCDESGFSGNNLLDQESSFFAYASVAIDHEEATEYVDNIIKKYKIQGGELKGRNLLKSPNGKKVIAEVLKDFNNRIKVAVYHKKFNLSCKFYEYIFEPALAQKNSLFYQIKFHRFISNLLYVYFVSQSADAEKIFSDFQKLMRDLEDTELNYLFDSLKTPDILPFDDIKTFCIHHRDTINQELNSLRGTHTGKWILELSSSALFSILCDWGKEFNQLKVFCDVSKPLKGDKEVFDGWIGREDKIYIDFFQGVEEPITFNLSQEVQFVESHKFPGIQIADVAAAACACAFREGNNEKTESWIEHIPGIMGGHSVIPDLSYIDPNTLDATRNLILLRYLAEKSINKQPLLDGIEEFLSAVTHDLSLNPSNRIATIAENCRSDAPYFNF